MGFYSTHFLQILVFPKVQCLLLPFFFYSLMTFCPLSPTQSILLPVTLLHCFLSFRHANTNTDRDCCIAYLYLNSYLRHIASWNCKNQATFIAFKTSLFQLHWNFILFPYIYLLIRLFWVLQAFFLFLAFPLVPGLPSYLSLRFTLWANLVSVPAPGVSSLLFTFHCKNSHLSCTCVLHAGVGWGFIYLVLASWLGSEKGHPTDRRSFINIFESLAHRWVAASLSLLYRHHFGFCSSKDAFAVPLPENVSPSSRTQAAIHPC